jgi:enterochelin esterase-like enzyme
VRNRSWRLLAPHLVLSVSALLVLGAGLPRLGIDAHVPSMWAAASAAHSAAVSPPSDHRVLEQTLWSPSLRREMGYAVFLPPGYDSASDARYPVLYMLHGLGGDRSQWARAGLLTTAADLMRRGEISPFIIVLPDGESGYWVDHAENGPRFGSYVSQDLVSVVDREYRTFATRDARALGGMSMGGHGALQLALNNPDTFRVVGAHSVALRTKAQAFEFFGDQRYFQAHDPVSLIQSHPEAARQLVISVDIGAGDQWLGPAEGFHRTLQAAGLVHLWSVDAGGHDEAYWAEHVAGYLRFYSRALQAGSASGE